jgi:dTDP-4-amino-4,6-dideoxygalactose transaminase
MKYMSEHGITLGIHYHPANHHNGVISSKFADLPITSKIANEVVSLPLYPELDIRSQDSVIRLLNEFK